MTLQAKLELLAQAIAGEINDVRIEIGSAGTGDWFFVPPGALVVNGNQADAIANGVYLQDKLDNYGTVVLPASGGVTDAFNIWTAPLLMGNGQTLIGAGPTATQIRAHWDATNGGANLDAIIAGRNWYDNTGAPSATSRNVTIVGVGVDGNYVNRSASTATKQDLTTDVRQTAGLGYGFAFATYISTFENCSAAQTRGHGFFLDTTGRDGTTGLGEGIEVKLRGCVTTRTGLGGFHITDTAGVNGGITDGTLDACESTHGNQRGVTGDEGTAMFIKSAGGWNIRANHIYGADGFASGNQWEGYGATQWTDGIYCKSSSGVRLIGNQVADFGYCTTTGTYYGIQVQGQNGNRGVIIANNTVFTDEDHAPNTLYAIRTTTVSAATDVAFVITGNTAESRSQASHGRAPVMQGIKMDGAGGGTIMGTVSANSFNGVAAGEHLTGNAALTNITVSGNSWQVSHTVGYVDAGATASTARPEGFAVVVWVVDNGVDPTNKLATDIVLEREAA